MFGVVVVVVLVSREIGEDVGELVTGSHEMASLSGESSKTTVSVGCAFDWLPIVGFDFRFFPLHSELFLGFF